MSFYDDMRPIFNDVTNYAKSLDISYDITIFVYYLIIMLRKILKRYYP